MEIEITRNVEGARQAEGLVVSIDVFRAFSTAYYLFEQGAKEIIVFENNEQGLLLKSDNPNCILIGESRGNKIKDFDYNNSPDEILKAKVKDKTVVLKTSKGTPGLLNVNHDKASEVIVGSFVGINAIVDYIRSKNPEKTTLVCMGEPDDSESYEDELCAQCIKRELMDENVLYGKVYDQIRQSEAAARFFNPDVNHSSPEDFERCMDFNRFDFIIKYDLENQRLYKQDSSANINLETRLDGK